MLKKYSLGVIFIFLGLVSSFSQNLNSPYSRFGVGAINGQGVTRNVGMAGVGQSSSSNMFLNLTNPALLARTKYTVLETGLGFNSSFLKTESLSQNTSNLNLSYFGISLPVAKSWSSAFGMKPYSISQYHIQQTSTLNDTTNIEYNYQGYGGINQFFWSNGFTPIKGVFFGLESSFLFGKTTSQTSSQLIFQDNGRDWQKNVIYERQSYNDFKFKPGFALRKEINVHRDTVNVNFQKVNPEYTKWKKAVDFCIDSLKSLNVKIKSDTSLAKTIKSTDVVKKSIKEQKLYCQNCSTEPSNSIKIDTSLVGDKFCGKGKHIKRLQENAIQGKFITLYLNESDIVISKNIKKQDTKTELFKLLSRHKPKNMGVFVHPAAEKTSKDSVIAELKRLVNSENFGSNNGFESEYIRKNSGVFFTLGGSVEFSTKVNSEILLTNQLRLSNDQIKKEDTLSLNETATVALPAAYHFGIGLEKPVPKTTENAKGKSGGSIWSLGLDFSYFDWKNTGYKNMANSYKVALGGELVPNYNTIKSSILPITYYRAGLFYEDTPFNINNSLTGSSTKIKNFGITFGVGIPVYALNNSYSSPRFFSLGMELGSRGTIANNMIRENYFNVSIGLTISDKWWFYRPKVGL